MQNVFSIPLEQMAATVASAPSAVLIADSRSILSANPAALALFGVSRPQELSQLPGLLHSEVDRSTLLQLLSAWSASGWSQASLRVCWTKQQTQTEALLDLKAWRVFLESGPAVQIQLRQLSPEEQSVMHRREEDDELRWVMELSAQISWTADAEGRITDFSKQWLELTGLTREQALGNGWQTVPHPDDLARMAAAWQHSVATGESYDVEHRIRTSTGEFQWMRSLARPRRNRAGSVVRWYGTTEDISGRKKAEALSHHNEQVASLALENARFGVWQLDLATNEVTRSLLHDQIFGYQEALPRWTFDIFLDHVHQDDRSRVETSFRRAKEQQCDWEFQARIHRKDGEIRWIWANGRHFRDEDGSATRLVGLVADITERRLKEEALLASEARASRILQSIGDAVIVTDANGLVLRMNPVAEDLTGWREAEARGEALDLVFAITEEVTGQRMEGPLHKINRKGAVVGLATNAVLTRRNGSLIHIDDSGAPILNDKGDLTGIVLVFRNIDERRAVELAQKETLAALQESETNLQIAAEVTRLGHARLDPATSTLLSCTDLFKANFGRGPVDPFAYPDLLASIHPEDLEYVRGAVRKAANEEETYQAEYRVIWPDGSLHWIQARGRMIKFRNRPAELEGVVLDVTERHLAQNALLQSEKLAAVGKLAASIAHEINNPLESVTNLLYLALMTENITPELREHLESADRELRRVAAITSQTLRFHRQSTRPRPVTAEALFESVLAIFHGKLINSSVVVEQSFRATQPIACFEGEIRQVLNNLVSNAVDVLHPAGGRLLVRSRDATCWRSGRSGMLLTIADSGPGMTPQVAEKAFEAFYTTKGIGGTGLGLWLSKEIISRHHGTLLFRSRTGQNLHGTVFTIFLPFDAVTRETSAL